jgi:hypothetical protein
MINAIETIIVIFSCSVNFNVFVVKLVGWFMVFHATFNNISVILWQSVLLVEETGVPWENYRPIASH